MSSNIAEEAARYVSMGINLVPLAARSKIPEAGIDLDKYFNELFPADRLQEMIAKGCNIAVICGKISLVIVIDIDGEPATQMWADTISKVPTLKEKLEAKDTQLVKTSGGYHIYLRFNLSEFEDGIGRIKLWKGTGAHEEIVIRGNGSYVVGAGSIHPDTGKVYERRGQTIPTITKAEYEQLLNAFNIASKSSTASRQQTAGVTKVSPLHIAALADCAKSIYSEGSRNDVGLRLIGDLRHKGFPEDAVKEFVIKLHGDDRDKIVKAVDATFRKDIAQINSRAELERELLANHDYKTVQRFFKQWDKLIKEALAASRKVQDWEDSEERIVALTEDVKSKFIVKATGQDRRLCIYNDGVYEEKDAEQAIERYLEEISPGINNHDVNEVLNKLRRREYVNEVEFDNNPYMINFRNVWYNWLEDKTYPHSPDLLSMHQLPYPYPEVKQVPKNFYRFMAGVRYPEDGNREIKGIHYPHEVKTAMDWMAYTFMKENKFELVCFKIGYGKNGKTTEDSLLKALHGGKSEKGSFVGGSVTGFSLRQIIENRFATYRMKGKALNIDAETDGRAIDMTELKRLASRDTIHEVEGKGTNFESVILNTKFQMNFNKDPIIINQSDGDIRRLLMLSYPHQFEGKSDDTDILQKLLTEEELSNIFAWVIAPALRRLNTAKSLYMKYNKIEDRRTRYELVTNPMKAATDAIFLSSSTSEDYVTKAEAYDAYKKFCAKNNLAVQSKKLFGTYLHKEMMVQDGYRGPKGKQDEVWLGLRVNPAYTVDLKQAQFTPAAA
ncbi:putative ATPase [Candidatus Nitrososphaera evergladensis SR1]|uniref:Putative ATPase n=1 Tax=Candidatus Nitrososphaera evergladensis SR1 TaxID=1459636 RepID=A0A075MRW4_9ARCH|nr:bifunctional DNA primase/polymerase [Candidatus Nitrososphaera evergladensis]AIF83835.1 putative ATPase [Candidatus Nitrososphaera evergladensis SR1]